MRLWGPRDEILDIPPQFRDTEPPLRIRYVDYISPKVGLVRREKMNGTGKRIEEVMILTKY